MIVSLIGMKYHGCSLNSLV